MSGPKGNMLLPITFGPDVECNVMQKMYVPLMVHLISIGIVNDKFTSFHASEFGQEHTGY